MGNNKLPEYQAVITDDKTHGVKSIEIVSNPLPEFEFLIIKENG